MKTGSVTITDIADRLGVNRTTVSRALNGDTRISEAMRTKVNKVAEKLNYRRNNIAGALRSGRTNTIGVMIPSAEINFFGRVVHGIESVASENGYNVLLFQSNESPQYEQRGLQTFLNAHVDGILVSVAKETKKYDHFQEVIDKGLPVMFFDRTVKKLKVPAVVCNDYQGAKDATMHLIEQGYKKIAHISGPQHMDLFRNRYLGYRDALKANNIKEDERYVIAGDLSIEAGREGMEKLLALKQPPDALFAVEDFTALGALKTLKEHGIKVPQQFGVIGFANERFDEHISPSLSSYDQQTVLMGRKSMDMMLGMISGNVHIKTETVMLDPIPMFRESSQRIRKITKKKIN